MLRAAAAGDEPAIETFLARHPETSMFLRANLRDFGFGGADDPRATRYWLAGEGGIEAVFGLTRAGFAMCQAPDAPPALFAAFAGTIAGRQVAGITGEAGQVAAMKAALGLDGADFSLDHPEPLYRLALERLAVPEGPGTLRRPIEADRARLTHWFAAYVEELRMSTPERRDAEARDRAERAIAGNGVRLLTGATPLAMTAFNARLPGMVQIGGVYTPPELRARGHARRAVALHLAEARSEGVKAAILFASGPAACRAYEAIGFRRIGSYALAILREPVIIGRGA